MRRIAKWSTVIASMVAATVAGLYVWDRLSSN